MSNDSLEIGELYRIHTFAKQKRILYNTCGVSRYLIAQISHLDLVVFLDIKHFWYKVLTTNGDIGWVFQNDLEFKFKLVKPDVNESILCP